MASDSSSILIDSNILIYAASASSEFHQRALTSLDRLEQENASQWISTQILREYLVHMTRADVLGHVTLTELVEQVERLCKHFTLAEDTGRVGNTLCELIKKFDVHGKAIHDANVVATCIAYGIPRLLTHNLTDFERYSSLIEIEALSNT